MKACVFYPRSIQCAWSVGQGLVNVLKRMGIEVIDAYTPPNPGVQQLPSHVIQQVRNALPSLETLQKQDMLIVSGPEHIACWLDAVYGVYPWRNELSVPKFCMYHESESRADGGQFQFKEIGWCGDYHLFPAAQDAEFYEQEHLYGKKAVWMPFAVDTEIFRPPTSEPQKKYDTVFIGSLYGPRAQWCEQLGQYNHPNIRVGNCLYQNLDGVDVERSMRMMADDIRASKVFLNMPALSLLHVTKVFEVMACGTFLLTREMTTSHCAHRNNVLFENGKHLEFYDAKMKAQLSARMNYWLKPENELERESIARQGMELIHTEHTLEKRFEKMFGMCGLTWRPS